MDVQSCSTDLEDQSELENILNLVKNKTVEELCQEFIDEGDMSNGMMKEYSNNELNAFLSSCNIQFASRDELQNHVQKITLEQGYVVVIRKSKPKYYVILGCDRGGRPRATVADDKRKRFTGSRLINCPFEVWGKRRGSSWVIEIKNLSHNHEPSEDMSGHPMCRRFSKDEMQIVKTWSMAGSAPREIMSALRKNNPNLQANSRTVYNTRAKIKKEDLGGRTMIEALFDELGDGGFIFDIERDEDDHLTHLFFIHPSSIVLIKNFPYVFIMDCTYKTNKYNMPVLDIIGISCFNTTFYSCIVFMRKEEEEDYIWALERFKKILGVDNFLMVIVTDRELALMNAIRVVFPQTSHLLCVWHIQKNVLAKCKKFFERGEEFDEFLSSWSDVIYSIDEVSFNENWSLFRELHRDKPMAIDYIRNNWLPYKEKFVFAWTERHLHFKNHASSKAEGAHSTLKKYLQVSTGNLREVVAKICLVIENQVKEIKIKLQCEKIRTSHDFRVPMFCGLLGNVSKHALEQLLNQYKLASSEKVLHECRGHFQSTMGLPCAHKLRCNLHGRIDLGDIHPQWRIDGRSFENMDTETCGHDDQFGDFLRNLREKYQKMPLSQKVDTRNQISQLVDEPLGLRIQEPHINPRRGRLSQSKRRRNVTSTQRDSSEFEIVERNQRCGKCGELGHNIRSCVTKRQN